MMQAWATDPTEKVIAAVCNDAFLSRAIKLVSLENCMVNSYRSNRTGSQLFTVVASNSSFPAILIM